MFFLISWLRLLMSYCLFVILIFAALRYKTSIYLFYQANGQINILLNTESIEEFKQKNNLSDQETLNLSLIEKIKKYSVDSLGYLPTDNFTTVYNQKNTPILWVITASEAFNLKAYEWDFPVVGRVSYKGFFRRELADKEYNRLRCLGYDVDLRTVSAWSTLGWFKDPILSNMLKRSKGGICNLMFHELFHATYYAPDAVNFNENIASFIAHHATIQYLHDDEVNLNKYLINHHDNKLLSNFMFRQNKFIRKFYEDIQNKPSKNLMKLKVIHQIADSVCKLPLNDKRVIKDFQLNILEQKNAFFIDFEQYDSMQDTLEMVFNKIYKRDLKKLVQDLKQNQTIIKFDN